MKAALLTDRGVLRVTGEPARHFLHNLVTANIETARRVGARRGAPVILAIQAAALHATGQPFLLTSNQVWLTASALYLATAYLIAIVLRQVERRYASIR